MKKTYITPELVITDIKVCQMIAQSPTVRINRDASVNAADIGVKSNRSSSYNVWDDDWSN